MKENRLTKELAVALTPEEFETKSRDLAKICQEIGLKQYLQKAAAKAAKEEIERLEDERAKLASVVKDKAEYRDVDCVERFDHTRRMAITVRLDTGEEIAHRAMEIHEYQEEMDLHANPAGKSVRFPKTAEA